MKKFSELVKIMAKLRGPGGCPWDLEQDHQSIKPYLLEEAYETIEAIEGGNDQEIKEELGDLLLQVVFHARLAEERKAFTIDDIIQTINQKLIRRHPHVFDRLKGVNSSKQVLKNWEEIKKSEGKKSALAGVPRSMPSLQRAWRVGSKASRVGFDWQNIDGVLAKILEEAKELKQAVKDNQGKERVEEEYGDLLFALSSLARFLDIEPEGALHQATNKFIDRFTRLEKKLAEEKKDIRKQSFEQLEETWQQLKKTSKSEKS